MNRCHYLATSLFAQTMTVKRRLLPLKSNFLLTFPENTFSKIWTIGIASSSSFMIYIVKYCCSSPLLQVAVAHCILYNIHTQTWILCGILKPLLKSGINHCHCFFLKRDSHCNVPSEIEKVSTHIFWQISFPSTYHLDEEDEGVSSSVVIKL